MVRRSRLAYARAPESLRAEGKLDDAVAIRDEIRKLHKGKALPEAVSKVVVKELAFDQASLERALQMLESEFKQAAPNARYDTSIRILGQDLQLEGITRNMSLRDFKQEDKTVGELLTAIVRRANPITTVKNPAEPDQKLIWVIGEDPNDGITRLLITTRAGAAKRGYKLPEAFAPK